MKRRDFLQNTALAAAALGLPDVAGANPYREIWLYIRTRERSVTLYQGYREPRPLRHFEPGAIGRKGAAGFRVRGSSITPRGRFRISRINEQSRFHRFFGFDYPTLEQAREGRRRGILSRRELEAVRMARRQGRQPPQTTALGGHIGLHGVNNGRSTDWDWTEGCVALPNHQIDILTPWLTNGTHVVVV